MFRSLPVMAAVAAAFLFSDTVLRAQTGERSRWDQVTLGNHNLGVDAVAWARARNFGTERRVDETAWVDIRLLGQTRQLQRIGAMAIRNGPYFHGQTALFRGGSAIWFQEVSATTTTSFLRSGNVFPFTPTATFFVVGIPITVGANVTQTGTMNTTLLNWNNNGAMLSGSIESYSSGWAYAAVGVPFAQAGVHATIQLVQQRFDGVLGAMTGYLSTAYLHYSMTPVRLLLRLFAEAGFPRKGRAPRWCHRASGASACTRAAGSS
jgi:hypothetical protein